MKKVVVDLANIVTDKVKSLIQENPYGYAEGISSVAQELESVRKYRMKDFDNVIGYLIEEELNLFKSNTSNEEKTQGSLVFDTSKKILEEVKALRRTRNRKTNRVDTNILTHAPYFAGGSKTRKQKAKQDGYIALDKQGIRKLTYENDMGMMLTMVDAKVLFSLFSIWEDQQFSDWLSFSEYQLLDKMGSGIGGKQYALLRESLEKLRNTSVVFNEAYNHEKGTRYSTERFKLIIADKFVVEEDKKGKVLSKEYSIQFSKHINTSIRSGYYSLVSLAILNELELATAQGIYLLLAGIADMDRKESYIKQNEEYVFDLSELYESLFLENESKHNRKTVERGCEELKESGVIQDFYFKKEGKKYSSLVITLSDWSQDIINRRENTTLETEQLSFLETGNLSNQHKNTSDK